MKQGILSAFGIVAIIAVFAACHQSENKSISSMADVGSERSAVPEPNQTNVQKMLRTASLKFRVKDVQKSTNQIEKMARYHGGYVAQSIFNIDEVEKLIKKKSTDSAEEIKKLVPQNHIEVFVLNTQLDTFLDKIQGMVDHLEYRHLTAYDKTIENTTAPSEGSVGNTANAFAVANGQQVNTKYARVSMDIYQTPVVKKWTIPNPDSFEVARGGFGEDFVNSLKSGWRGLGIGFNVLISLWPLLLFALGGYWWYKRRGKKITYKAKKAE